MITGWQQEIVAAWKQCAATSTSATSNSPAATPSAMTPAIIRRMVSLWAWMTPQFWSIGDMHHRVHPVVVDAALA